MHLKPETALAKDRRSALCPLEHRHFAAIATIIRDLHAQGTMSLSDAGCVADHFADALAKTNPRFDRARFMAACAGEE